MTAAEGECGFGGMCEGCVRRGRVHVCALARRGQSVCLAFFSVFVSLFEHTHKHTHRDGHTGLRLIFVVASILASSCDPSHGVALMF